MPQNTTETNTEIIQIIEKSELNFQINGKEIIVLKLMKEIENDMQKELHNKFKPENYISKN